MSQPDPVKSVVAEAPAAQPAAAAAPKAAARLELDGDEIIQLSIRPSLWLIPLASLNVLLIAVFLGAACALAMHAGATPVAAMPFQVLAGLAALRTGLATLDWASRLYVLTNQRVLRFRGVLKVDVVECRLATISGVDLHVPWHGRVVRLGTIRMRPADAGLPQVVWEDVGRPQEIHELLVRAIRKAQSGG